MAVTDEVLQRTGISDPFTSQIGVLNSQRAPLLQRRDALATEQGALAQRNEELTRQRGEAVSPAREAIIDKTKNAPPMTAKEEAVPSYQRPTVQPDELRQSFGMLMAASMLVGAMSRTPFSNSMAAMTGAMEGFVKEDAAVVKESLATFDRNVTAIRERNSEKRREVEAAWKTHEHDLQGLKQQLEQIAAKYDDPLALNAARSKSISEAQKQIDGNIRTIDQTTERLLRDKSNMETKLAQMEQTKELRQQTIELQRQGLELKRQAAGAGAATNTGGLSADYQNNPEYAKQVDFWAQYVHDGNALPPRFAQSGAGKKMFSDIVSRAPQLGSGDPREMQANAVALTGQKSQSRALGTRTAAIEQAASEAREMSSIVLDTSAKFPRTDYQPINKVWAAYQKNTGSAEVRQFGASLNSYINAYARAVNPTGVGTVADKEHAREMLSTADSHDQVKGILSILDREMTAAQHSPSNVKESLRNEITGRRSTDGGGGLRAKVEAAGGTYEPDTYEYRETPDGKVQRRPKGQ